MFTGSRHVEGGLEGVGVARLELRVEREDQVQRLRQAAGPGVSRRAFARAQRRSEAATARALNPRARAPGVDGDVQYRADDARVRLEVHLQRARARVFGCESCLRCARKDGVWVECRGGGRRGGGAAATGPGRVRARAGAVRTPISAGGSCASCSTSSISCGHICPAPAARPRAQATLPAPCPSPLGPRPVRPGRRSPPLRTPKEGEDPPRPPHCPAAPRPDPDPPHPSRRLHTCMSESMSGMGLV